MLHDNYTNVRVCAAAAAEKEGEEEKKVAKETAKAKKANELGRWPLKLELISILPQRFQGPAPSRPKEKKKKDYFYASLLLLLMISDLKPRQKRERKKKNNRFFFHFQRGEKCRR